MSEMHEDEPPKGWGARVRFARGAEGFAYRPSEVVVGGQRGLEAAERMFPSLLESEPEPVFPEQGDNASQYFVLRGDVDVIGAVHELRVDGVLAQPNHVVFSHGAGCCCGPHPSVAWAGCLAGSPMYGSPMYGSPMYGSPMYGSPMYGSPMYGSPMYGSPMYASPMYASPMYASPVYGSPVYASDLQATGRRKSSAVPTTAPALPSASASSAGARVRVGVLDTGMAADGYRPAALDTMAPTQQHWEIPDDDGDQFLDPAAGHGTFIAGLVDLLAPGCDITVEKVLSNYGDGDEVAVAQRIAALAGSVDLLNASLGGYAMTSMDLLATAVRRATAAGTVVVASAGNDATCRPTYPAALPDVVGVGAVGPQGPAPFTNYGPWVRACAPGVDVVSWFFSKFDGPGVATSGAADPDRFEAWAKWSGTSFAAPTVVAALAREMRVYDVDASEAVRRVVDAPGLLRLPQLGTVVNVS